MAFSSYLEVRLDWLISKSVHLEAYRRLNEIENMLSRLMKLGRPLDPATELRMSEQTRQLLVFWVEEHEPATGDAVTRLAVYRSPALITTGVPDGWLRVARQA